MDVVFTIQHPANVHIFKNPINILQDKGHNVHVFSRRSEVSEELLYGLDIEHEELVSEEPSGILSLAKIQSIYEYKMLRRFLDIRPEAVVSLSGVAASHAAYLTNTRNIVFINNDHATLENYLSTPFADIVYTPRGFEGDFGDKQQTYDSYDWLAYTHPSYFTPNSETLKSINQNPNSNYIVLRLVAWNAAHDFRKSRRSDLAEIISRLEQLGYDIVLSAEGNIPSEFEKYQVKIEPHHFHDILFYSDLYIGEGAATAMEAALLGTPAIYLNELKLGYLRDFEARYGTIQNMSNSSINDIVEKSEWLLSGEIDASEVRQKVANEKSDMNKIIVDSILNP